jgi:hypothetical protein
LPTEQLAARTAAYAHGQLTDGQFHARPGIEPAWVAFLAQLGIITMTEHDLTAINRAAQAARSLTRIAGRKPVLQGGLARKLPLNRMPLPLDVLADNAQRRAAARRGQVGRGPEMSVQGVPVHAAGELRSQVPGRHALQAVHQRRDCHLRRIPDQKMYVIVFAVEIAQFRAEVSANFPHGVLAAAEHVRVEHAMPVSCHEDQMSVERGNYLPATAIIII